MNGTTCEPCPARYQATTSRDSCEACVGNTYSNLDTAKCMECPTNQIAKPDHSECIYCPDRQMPGIYDPVLGTSNASCHCKPGFYNVSATGLFVCFDSERQYDATVLKDARMLAAVDLGTVDKTGQAQAQSMLQWEGGPVTQVCLPCPLDKYGNKCATCSGGSNTVPKVIEGYTIPEPRFQPRTPPRVFSRDHSSSNFNPLFDVGIKNSSNEIYVFACDRKY